VVDHGEANVLGVNTIVFGRVIFEEGIRNVDSTRDRSVSGNLSLHLISTSDLVVVADVVLGVFDSPAFVLAIFTDRWWGPGAVLACVNRSHGVLEVVSNVLLARASHKSGIVSVLVNLSRVTSIARATGLSVDNDLSVNGDGSSGR
jgi:hypothetical protein